MFLQAGDSTLTLMAVFRVTNASWSILLVATGTNGQVLDNLMLTVHTTSLMLWMTAESALLLLTSDLWCLN